MRLIIIILLSIKYFYAYTQCTSMKGELAEKIAGEITLSSNPGQTIRKWREAFGISQREIAEKLNRSPSFISDYESGRRKSPGISTVKKIVMAMLEIDESRGGLIIKRYTSQSMHEAILAMRDFPIGRSMSSFLRAIKGKVVNTVEKMKREIYGYTVIDSVRAIISLSAMDYLKLYGRSSERAFIFVGVKFGRSPMVAIRAHPMKPAVVVYHKPERVDDLALRLAEIESIPLVVTEMHLDTLIDELKKL